MIKWWKGGLIAIMVTLMITLTSLMGICGEAFADGGAWVGEGTGSSGGGSGGTTDCPNDSRKWWIEDCAGWSWAYYQAQRVIDYDVTMEQVGYVVVNPVIPKTCSAHGKEGGFWHRGVNMTRGCLTAYGDGSGYPNRGCGENSRWTGHWKTLVNAGKDNWMEYKTPLTDSGEIDGKAQKVGSNGEYVLKEFAGKKQKAALKAYKAALKEDKKGSGKIKYNGKTTRKMSYDEIEAITEIPDGVWGFCSWEGAGEPTYTLRVKSVDYDSGELLPTRVQGDKISNPPTKVGEATSATVDDLSKYGYEFKGFRVKQRAGEPKLGSVNGYTISVTSDEPGEVVRYAVYKKIPKVKITGLAVEIKCGVRTAMHNFDVQSEPVKIGGKTSVTPASIPGYTMLGWGETRNATPDGNTGKHWVANLQENKTVFMFYEKNGNTCEPEEATLYGVAIDNDTRKPLNMCDPDPKTALKGKYATIKRKTCPDEYTFKGWTKTQNGNPENNSKWYFTWPDKMMQDHTVYLVYAKKVPNVELKGIAIDITNTPRRKFGTEYYPDPDSGPKGTNRTIYAKPIDGYDIVGWGHSWDAMPEGGAKSSFTWKKMQENNTVYVFYKKRPPSQCEEWTPASYRNSNSETIATTSTISKVANSTLSTNWKDQVYAKPTDKIDWKHCYFPGVQKMADALVTPPGNHKSQAERNTCADTSPSCYRTMSYSLGNVPMRNLVRFENQYRVDREFSPGKSSGWKYFTVGDPAIPVPYEDNGYGVSTLQVGQTLTEGIKTGVPEQVTRSVTESGPTSWRCDWQYSHTVHHHDLVKDSECTTDDEGNKTCTDPVYNDWDEDKYDWSSTCSHDEPYVEYRVSKSGPVYTSASVLVPYNFNNSIELNEIDKNDESGRFYAGESKTLSSMIHTDVRENVTLNGTYATKVPNAKIKLELCWNGTDCRETVPKSISDLNPGGNMEGAVRDDEKVTFNVPDLPAGTEICMRSAVYPKDSRTDTSMSTTEYPINDSNSWAWSPKVCARVAKRPSVQVLGGNTYSNGEIKTGLSTKNLLYGQYTENDKNLIDSSRGYKKRTFGSWGELGAIAQGNVQGFASGNTLGYSSMGSVGSVKLNEWTVPDRYRNDSNNGKATSTPGGSEYSNLCNNLSPLTAVRSCGGNSGSGVGKSSKVDVDLTSLKRLAESANNSNSVGSVVEYSGSDSYVEIDGMDENTFYRVSGDAMIGGAGLEMPIRLVQNTYKIVVVSGKATIKTNIETDEANTYKYGTFTQLPKMVIYAHNIDVACDVSRIDAVLAADGKVTTCAPEEDDLEGLDEEVNDDEFAYNDIKNLPVFSNQLVVNGAIVTRQIELSRTYGAARGQNSMVSAEVINFDPTLYLWGGLAGETKGSDNKKALNGDLETTYIHELAPRQ